jgi:tetratricopeptide (TPR) repeat protein
MGIDFVKVQWYFYKKLSMKKICKRLSVTLLSLTIALGSFAQTTATEWYNKATKLFDDEQYKEAAVAFDKASQLDPKKEDAFYKAGWCYNDLGKYENAIDRLNKTVALNKNNHLAWQELGYAYKKTSKSELALSCLKKAIEIKPNYALAYKQMGDVYQNMDREDDAITAYKKCYANDEENDDACYNLGYIYNGKAEYTTALEWLNKANKIKEGVDVFNEIGFSNYKLKNNDEAINAYKGALKINSENGTAYKGMGDVYRLNYSPAKVAEAIESYLKAIEYNHKSSGSHYGLGWCYNDKSRYEEAIPMLAKAIELDKTFGAAYSELGYAYYMTAKYTDGLATLKAGLVQNNKSTLCRYYSGLIYVKQKDIANATIMYNELKPLDAKLAEKLQAKISAM